MVKIYMACNDIEWAPARRKIFEGRLNVEMRHRADRFRSWQDAQSYILGKLMVACCLRIDWTKWSLAYTNRGRPYLPGAPDFNISHSEGMVVCAISSFGRVGIDIEREREMDLPDMRRFFGSGGGREDVPEDADPMQRFFDRWTKIEAVVKADGCGLLIRPGDVRLFPDRALFRERIWILKNIPMAGDYVCHIAVEKDAHVSPVVDITRSIDRLQIQ